MMETHNSLQWTTLFSVGLLFAFAVHSLVPSPPAGDPKLQGDIWKYDLEQRRIFYRNKISKAMAKKETDLHGPQYKPRPSNWSLDEFIDKYLINPTIQYKTPDNWTIQNLIANNEHALFRPYVIEDYVAKYGVEDDLSNKATRTDNPDWTFNDFIDKYEPRAVLEQVSEHLLNVAHNTSSGKKFCSIVDRMDSTEELLSLVVPVQRSGRRWRASWYHPQPYANQKIKANDDLNSTILFMKQAIYEAREKLSIMQQLREDNRKKALYKMGYLFAKTDYACKIFSSLAFKSYRTCSLIRQRLFGEFRLFQHFMDIIYSIERLEHRWFDVDILTDLLNSNDIIARKVILKDRNLTSPKQVVQLFDNMFVD